MFYYVCGCNSSKFEYIFWKGTLYEGCRGQVRQAKLSRSEDILLITIIQILFIAILYQFKPRQVANTE